MKPLLLLSTFICKP